MASPHVNDLADHVAPHPKDCLESIRYRLLSPEDFQHCWACLLWMCLLLARGLLLDFKSAQLSEPLLKGPVLMCVQVSNYAQLFHSGRFFPELLFDLFVGQS